jgi:hypothetical protein
MYKLLISFQKLGFPSFLSRAQGIKTALTSEPALTLIPDPWPATYPSRAQLVTAFGEFETAYDASQDGGKTALTVRNLKREALTEVLKNLAPYLESVARAAGDVSILDVTGYERRQPAGHGNGDVELPAPVITLRHGELSGVLLARASSLRGAGSYETQYCTGDPSVPANWQKGPTTTGCRRIELEDLTPGQLYYVRIRGIGSNGPGAWSDVASLRAN